VEVLNAIYETDFLGFSYGLRLVPGTSKVLYEFVENPDDARQDAPLVGAEATQ
jgi:hypothetical protein